MNQAEAVAELVLLFDCGEDQLVGILHAPAAAGQTGVVIVVGGPQYRVGSHRQFVLLARALAAAGYPVLRFDVRGMGDSDGAARNFEAIGEDIAAAVDCLQRRLPRIERVVLWGLCDGASAALLYWHATRDARVSGLSLLNPWVRSEASLAITHVKHYYAGRLLERSFWRKFLRGGISAAAVGGLIRAIRTAASSRRVRPGAAPVYQRLMAEAWKKFGGRTLLVLSGRDLTAREFVEYVSRDEEWGAAFDHDRLDKFELAMADHTFSDAKFRSAVETTTVEWLGKWMRVVPEQTLPERVE